MSTTTTPNTAAQAIMDDTITTDTFANLGDAVAAAMADASPSLPTFPEPRSKRTEANRRNAQKSTGPRTKDGKRRVSMNAVKHGLTAQTLVLPGEDPAALQEHIDTWKDELRPRNPLEDLLAERLAHASWRADRADRAIAARLTHLMLYADADDLAAELDEVEDLGRRLYWDPRGPLPLYPHGRGYRPTPRISTTESIEDPLNPARIVNKLERTATGCRWLLERWGELRKLLEAGLKWQGPDRFKAIRMLGRQPMDAADDSRVLRIYLACDAMSPGAPTSLGDLECETTHDEGQEFGRRIAGRDAAGRNPADPAAGLGVLLGLVEEAARRLEILLEGHRERRAALAAVRLARRSFDETKEGELARRYELSCDRAVHRAANLFFRVRKEIDALGEEESGPDRDVAAAIDAADETNPMAVAPPVDGWSGFTEVGDDETEPTAVAAPFGAGDETKPTTAAAPLESRLQAESAIGSADETKPSPAGFSSATTSDHAGPRDGAAADPQSPNAVEEGPTPPGGAEPIGPDRSPPPPAIVLEVLARRRAEFVASSPLDVRPPRAAKRR